MDEASEIDLVTLSPDEWQEVLAAAAELDLIPGGHFRARDSRLLFYGSPDNAPEGWTGPFNEGSPEMPRALVGEAEVAARDEENGVTVRLRVSNWGAVRGVKQAYDQGEFGCPLGDRFQEYVMAQEAALRGRTEDRRWLKRQFARLRSHAAGKLVEEN
jgi:hypothetical protein